MKHKIQQGDPGLLSSWSPGSDRNGTTFLSQRSSSWTPQFQMFTDVVKRRGGATQGETWTCPYFFEMF